MDGKEAELLEYILDNAGQVLTTTKLAEHFNVPMEELRPILDRLEDWFLITIGVKTPQGQYYNINPAPHADQALEPIINTSLGPDHSFQPLSRGRTETPEA